MRKIHEGNKYNLNLEEALKVIRDFSNVLTFAGKLIDDHNFQERKLVVLSTSEIISIQESDILTRYLSSDGLDIVQIHCGAQIWRIEPSILTIQSCSSGSFRNMENLTPPTPPTPKEGDPIPATAGDQQQLLKTALLPKSIVGAASLYSGQCAGGDSLENNCAHYLSDAFIRAGYDELLPSNDCVTARCGTDAKRVIRAKDMWCWFKSIAKESRTVLPNKEGFWAVFQWKEGAYPGGHVTIIDTDNSKYYGTGNYPNWDQYAYKW
ncbi:MAG: hypothetical protein Q7T74_03070 [Candidatus Saccharibacteria bacterium]|nr:hypothetical protein [Candidatus Saccharibacteria bacterium]